VSTSTWLITRASSGLGYGACWREGNDNPALRNFIGLLENAIRRSRAGADGVTDIPKPPISRHEPRNHLCDPLGGTMVAPLN
jgi:hypothetical protein